MVNSEERQCTDDRRIDDADQDSDGEESVVVSFNGPATSANSFISRRLTAIFLEGGDEDLLLQRSDKENDVLQWLRALDLQVTGACRADERLKPLLKLNVSSGEAEDRLLAQLGEHFEPSEVGLLARCLCVPLVSIRVGKISKHGTLLSPTSVRGNLCLTLLPTSDLRISLNGDDGSVERLATLSSESLDIQEISADNSCRSFLIKTMDGVVYYFWCCEKSQLVGNELLRKMKNLLIRRPLLSELSGISEGRLNSFATHLRAYLSADASGVFSASVHSDNDSSEIHFSQSCENNSLASTNSGNPSISTFLEKDKVPETYKTYPLSAFDFLEALSNPAKLPSIQIPSLFDPPTESLRLLPLSCLLSKSSLNLAEAVPPLDFPSFPLTSPQIPTFAPMMCAPIPVGPGYLGPPLNAEKSGRETLCRLISGTNQPNPQLLPSVLNTTNNDDSIDEMENLFLSPFDTNLEF